MDNKETGQKGEQLAAEYLKNKGYLIREMNWRYGQKEIDIIAETKNTIVVAEVKCRTAPYLIEPELSVNISKQKLLISAANAYVLQKKLDKEVRFDIISIVLYKISSRIDHIEDAFYPKVK